LINKRINAEKDKIFELKLNIKLKTMCETNGVNNNDQQQNLAKIILDLNSIGGGGGGGVVSKPKELITTKL
jgi:hypothetical protein